MSPCDLQNFHAVWFHSRDPLVPWSGTERFRLAWFFSCIWKVYLNALISFGTLCGTIVMHSWMSACSQHVISNVWNLWRKKEKCVDTIITITNYMTCHVMKTRKADQSTIECVCFSVPFFKSFKSFVIQILQIYSPFIMWDKINLHKSINKITWLICIKVSTNWHICVSVLLSYHMISETEIHIFNTIWAKGMEWKSCKDSLIIPEAVEVVLQIKVRTGPCFIKVDIMLTCHSTASYSMSTVMLTILNSQSEPWILPKL